MTIPAGTYAIDASHSEVGFTIRHAGIAKVRGVFNEFDGRIVVNDDLATSSATATIKAASVDTGNEQRDGHLQSSDFFSIDVNPEWTFTSTGVSFSGEEGTLTGDLTINGVTKPVTLEVEYNGAAKDAYGNDRIGFSAETELHPLRLRDHLERAARSRRPPALGQGQGRHRDLGHQGVLSSGTGSPSRTIPTVPLAGDGARAARPQRLPGRRVLGRRAAAQGAAG